MMDWEPHRPSAPGTPSSMSSGNSGGSSARTEKTPNVKQLSPSPSVAALSKIPDPELRMKGPDELVRILRRVEVDYKSLLGEHGNVVKDVNRRLQIFVLETRGLKENVHKLQEDNQELRDLCCFLDDDRQKGRKLAREWQRFGRYTASVMRSEVAVYQEKLKELEDRQSELITENMDLKELCLYLDQERLRTSGDRDEGDGSSNGTITGPEDGLASPTAVETSGSVTPTPATSIGNYPTTPSSTASYIKELELKIQRLEEEKKHLAKKLNGGGTDSIIKTQTGLDGSLENEGLPLGHQHNSASASTTGDKEHLRKSPVASKPEAVVHAMKVLEVHEELEKSVTEEDLDAPEKAIVREMCNVVWRKLGDVGDVGNLNESSDSILDPPFLVQSPGEPDQAAGAPSSANPTPPFSQGPAHSYSLAQPQPQMASTPLASAPVRPVQSLQSQGNPHNDPNLKLTVQAGERNPMTSTRLSQGPNYHSGLNNNNNQQQQQHLRQQPSYLINQQHHHQQRPSLNYGPSGPQSSNPQHHHMNTPGSKPSMPPAQFPPSSFAPIHSNHSQSQRPPPLSLPQYANSSSGGPSAFSSAKDIQQRPLSSPTKSLSDHLPFSHPSFQHHQQHQHLPAVSAPHPRQGDHHRPQFSHGQPPQQSSVPQGHPQSSQTAHPSMPTRTSSAPQRPPYQNLQQQQQQQQQHQLSRPSGQQDSGIGSSHQPSTVRLLGAPGNRSRSAETADKARSAGQASGYQRAAPGGPPQLQQSASHRNVGPNSRYDMDAGPTHNQPKPRGGSEDVLSYEKRGMLSSRDSAPPNPSSSDSNPYGPLPYSQEGIKTSGFRAYPPQPSLLPSQSASSWGMAPRPTDRVGPNPVQSQPPNSHRGTSGVVQPNLAVPPAQNKGPHGKRFQEQEWRQTYLDDSDTL